MQQINEIIINAAISILVILTGIAVKSIKEYLVKKGGEQTVKIVETGYKGEEKLEQARIKIRAELNKYNIGMTDKDLDTFVESAVKQMNDAWKGDNANV